MTRLAIFLIRPGCQHGGDAGQLVPWRPDIRSECVTVPSSQHLDPGVLYTRLGGRRRHSSTKTAPSKLATGVSRFFQDIPDSSDESGLGERLVLGIDEQGAR